MIGHLQRNKVRMVLPWISMVHSVDSLRLAEEISSEAQRIGRVMPILIEVNVSGEKSKFGIAVGATSHLIENINKLPGISIIGLMTMAPFEERPENTRPYFCAARTLRTSARAAGGPDFAICPWHENDFEVAIERSDFRTRGHGPV
jgi:uncharacterized pyridoxal phosphate-containing UPF0001 family protein